MSTQNDGGPAFPQVKTEMQYDQYTEQNFPCAYTAGGMTLRDWFAGQALAGMLANSAITEHPSYSREGAACEAMRLAAYMLAAREAKQ